MTTLSTIGYEGSSLDDFIDTLQIAGITNVIDIRDVPASRRPGFSKNVLSQALNANGISYLHLKPLGDPKPGREAAREGRFDLFRSIYLEHLSRPEAQTALTTAIEIAKSDASVLLCYERDPKHCHRTLVADAMKAVSTFKVRDLVRKRQRPAGSGRVDVGERSGAVAIAAA